MINKDNYFSEENNMKYTGSSQIKDFLKCESYALAKLNGEWVDEKYGRQRPVAVMIENTKACLPQYGIGNAGVIYECVVEGGITRMMAIFDDYTGLKVPREAIRFNSKKEKGVYVILGQDVQFKKIDIVYEGEDYVLSKNTSNEDYLLLYDQILLEAVKNGNSE